MASIRPEREQDRWMDGWFDSSETSHKTFVLFFSIYLVRSFFFLFPINLTCAVCDSHPYSLCGRPLLSLISPSIFIFTLRLLLFLLRAVHHFASAPSPSPLPVSGAKPKLSSSLLPLIDSVSFPPQCFHQLSCRHISSRCSLFYIYHIKPICILFHPPCAFKTTNFRQMLSHYAPLKFLSPEVKGLFP